MNNKTKNQLSLQESNAKTFLEALLVMGRPEKSNDGTSPEEWWQYCHDETTLSFEHASFNFQPWRGIDQVERQWRLLLKSEESIVNHFQIVSMVSKPGKVAVRFVLSQTSSQSEKSKRGVAVLDMNQDTDKVESVYWVTESEKKAGAESLKLLRTATRVMELTGFNPAKQSSLASSSNENNNVNGNAKVVAPLAYFEAWNNRDIDAAVAVFADDVTYDDTAFPEPFQGKTRLSNHLNVCADCFPDSFSFQVDDCIESSVRMDKNSRPQEVFVQWHVENNGETLPYTRGCSFYQLNKQGLIQDGIDFVEPNGPVKPGDIDLIQKTVTSQIQDEPIRLLPLALWVAYIGIVFFSDGILPGANALQLEPRTWEEVLNLSLNFFFVAPLLGLPFSPVVHPLLESVFNGLLAWAALFAGFLTDERRNKPNLMPMVPIVVGMQFLTSAFFLPYLAFRSSESKDASVTQQDTSVSLPAQIGENRALPAVLGSVGVLSLYWAWFGRVEDFGTFPERWSSFVELLSIDRVGSSFIVDLVIFGLFQGWLIDDDALRRGGVNPVLKNVGKFVPFFGLVAYLAMRPSLPESSNQ